jgi:hypothetical protein
MEVFHTYVLELISTQLMHNYFILHYTNCIWETQNVHYHHTECTYDIVCLEEPIIISFISLFPLIPDILLF